MHDNGVYIRTSMLGKDCKGTFYKCCGVVYVSGVSAVVCARRAFFDEEPFAVLSRKKAVMRLMRCRSLLY